MRGTDCGVLPATTASVPPWAAGPEDWARGHFRRFLTPREALRQKCPSFDFTPASAPTPAANPGLALKTRSKPL